MLTHVSSSFYMSLFVLYIFNQIECTFKKFMKIKARFCKNEISFPAVAVLIFLENDLMLA